MRKELQVALPPPPSPVAPTASKKDPIALLEARFPEINGRERRIKHLWGNYWRVNFHDVANSNFIAESFFCEVDANGVTCN